MKIKFLGPRCLRFVITETPLAVNFYINKPLGSWKTGPSWNHGDRVNPKLWPWWKFFALATNGLGVQAPTTGQRFWLYTRRLAFDFDVVFDRRDLTA
jgi:hypothetical protein